MNRILIIQTAYLGDVILATPVISELARIFPDARIDFLVKRGNESLLMNNPHLHEVHLLDKSNGKWKAIFALIKRFRKNEYDLVVNLHRYGSSALITIFSKAKKTHGFKESALSFFFKKRFPHNFGDGTHEVERNLSLIKDFGAKSMVRPELFPSKNDFEAVSEYINENYICIAPASVWFSKQLPPGKWIELIRSFPENATVYLLGSPADKTLCSEIELIARHNGVQNLAGKFTLLQSAALMKQATRCHVNDSGPLHMASAMNAKVTAYFCSTIPEFGFGPLSDDAKVKQITEKLECRPCGIHGYRKCPQGHFQCSKIDLS